jgi:hypothetical protein
VTPFFEQLGDELDRAALRLHRRRRRRVRAVALVGAAAVAVAVALVVGVLVGRDDHAAVAGTQVVNDNGFVDVTLPIGTEPVDTVRAALGQAGLLVVTRDAQTGPSQVGNVVRLVADGAAISSTPDGTLTARLPVGSTVTLFVGVQSTSGNYVAFTDALAPGEPLHCVTWAGAPASELADAPTGLTLDFRDGGDHPVARDDLDGRVVREAVATSARSVVVTVGPGSPAPRPATCP